MNNQTLPDPELLRQLIDYDPETGLMMWRTRPVSMFPDARSAGSWNARYAGLVTSSSRNPEGYVQVSILSRKYRAHRVVWAIHYGSWPDGEIDHINRNAYDNRIENLRVVSGVENLRNKGKYSNNRSGHKGVTWHKSSKKWMAQLKHEGRNLHLGLFSCPEEAGRAYSAKRMELFGF